MSKLHIAYDDVYLKWKLGTDGDDHPTNPIRARYATDMLTAALDVELITPNATDADRKLVESIHDYDYVSDVLDRGHSGQWRPDSIENGQVALEMFAGTVRLVEKMLANEAIVAFNPQGAKHHAQFANSSGFCVFNDMAWAALAFNAAGLKTMYIDWDAHHGDGVENLLRPYPHLVTASIHENGIFPGTGLNGHDVKGGVYNWALTSLSGDVEFLDAMQEIELLADEIQPDVILLAAGADAHYSDPLSSLTFDYPGYRAAARIVGDISNKHAKGRVLIGGAGGYQPFDHTPNVWATVVSEIYSTINNVAV